MSRARPWFHISQSNGCTVVSFCGEHFGWAGHDSQKDQILDELLLLPTAPQDRIVLDLRRVKRIAGDGLSIVARFLKQVLDSKCRAVALCRTEVREVFEVTKLDKLLPLYDSVQSATEYLTSLADKPIIVTFAEQKAGRDSELFHSVP